MIEELVFLRCISHNKFFSPFLKNSLANSHLSGTIFLKPCEINRLSVNLSRIWMENINNNDRLTYISIKLANKAGEVVVFKVVGEDVSGKLWRAPNNKS